MRYICIACVVLGLAFLAPPAARADEPEIEEIPPVEPMPEPPREELEGPPVVVPEPDPEDPASAAAVEPTEPMPCEGQYDFYCYRRWICALREGPDGALDCAPCVAPAAGAVADPCRPVCYGWQRVPVYRTVCRPTYETKEVPCYARRRVPRYRYVSDPTGTTTRRVVCGWQWETYACGSRTVRCRTGWEQEQVLCGYRCRWAPVSAAAPAAPAAAAEGCRPGRWVTVTNCPDVSKIALLDHTVEVITEAEYERLQAACAPCEAPQAE